MANERPQGRLRSVLWDYEYVDTNEGDHWRVFDLNGNYHGSFGSPDAAAASCWEHNLAVAIEQGRVIEHSILGTQFVHIGPCLGTVPGRSCEVLDGQIILGQGGIYMWIDSVRFNLEYREWRPS